MVYSYKSKLLVKQCSEHINESRKNIFEAVCSHGYNNSYF